MLFWLNSQSRKHSLPRCRACQRKPKAYTWYNPRLAKGGDENANSYDKGLADARL